MYKADLIEYLKGDSHVESFFDLIKDELQDYQKGLMKKGTSVPIKFDGDLENLDITEKEYQKIISDITDNKADKFFFSYIADALLLSERTVFESEDLRDKFESLTEL